MILERRQAVVLGSGLAGLTVALSLGQRDVLVVTKTEGPVSGSTPWAQGGVAFPRDEDDVPLHIHDTLVSGAGHTDPAAAKALVSRAFEAREWLEAQGVLFDKQADGTYQYGREGAHTARRILHVGADGTGAGLSRILADRLAQAPWITVRARTFAVRLVPGGLLTFEEGRGLVLILSPRIFLAGGGLGQLFAATTAPAEATGDAIALALEAGAPVSDLEMVQFHPTALALREPVSPNLSLLTEALRGEGAQLVTAERPDGTGLRLLETGHPLGSLGPRDVLSRAIFHRQSAGFPVWLDARAVLESARKFPTVTRLCAQVGLNPAQDLLPIVPAVHYTMGGINTNRNGQTGLPGVWAAGEAARTGVHGANRLASNSLLECVVWGRAAAADAIEAPLSPTIGPTSEQIQVLITGFESRKAPSLSITETRLRIQTLMVRAAGPVRTAEGLNEGLKALTQLQTQWDESVSREQLLSELTFDQVRAILEVKNLLLLGPALLTQALARTESLGAHHRGDRP